MSERQKLLRVVGVGVGGVCLLAWVLWSAALGPLVLPGMSQRPPARVWAPGEPEAMVRSIIASWRWRLLRDDRFEDERGTVIDDQREELAAWPADGRKQSSSRPS